MSVYSDHSCSRQAVNGHSCLSVSRLGAASSGFRKLVSATKDDFSLSETTVVLGVLALSEEVVHGGVA